MDLKASTQPDISIHTTDSAVASNWIGAWYAAPIKMQEAHLTGRTLYQIVHLHIGGQQIRIRLSNRYGDKPIRLASILVGRSVFGLMREEPVQVTFNGQETVVIGAGTDVISDPIHLQVEAFSNLAISFAVAEGDISTGHFIATQTSYVSIPDARNNITAIEELLPAYPLATTAWWALTAVEVLPEHSTNVIVALGDSTTDGYGSTVDTNRRWPDYLARRLASISNTHHISVLNAGISFNELLTSRFPLAGEATLRRLTWDVLEQPSVTDVILQIGINDLRNDAEASAIINGLQRLVSHVRERGIRIFGSTILPGDYTDEQARQWHIVNTWIREQGAQWFDGVFDFAKKLRHPVYKSRLHTDYNSGDNIHPNDAGYQLMAETVDLVQLINRPSL